ncbi:MAG: DEAD/DEAH box helicase [Candidatus Ancillula trichonymphae]|nr:DEAD/DEAH box helicase [Candidatus Ancillula trichonymphae]
MPLLDKITGGNAIPRALIILPTRELAIQVTGELKIASSKRTDKISILTVYGGVKIEAQVQELKSGVDIVVGTPGRIVDLVERAALDLSEVEYLVLDEADRMLDFGFIGSIERIISGLPSRRQTLLFSATLSSGVLQLAKGYTENAVRISTLADSSDGETVGRIENFVYLAHRLDKPELLARMLQSTPREKSIVFTKMKMRAESLCKDLEQRGFNAYSIHGGLEQARRERILKKFKESPIDVPATNQAVLVASDVMARGIDIDNISHVYNYECPDDDAAFLHRTGRTGRAGGVGVSVTFVDWEDVIRWELIVRSLNMTDAQPQETYSSGVTYRVELGVPEDATGFVNGATKQFVAKTDTSRKPGKSNNRGRSSSARTSKKGQHENKHENAPASSRTSSGATRVARNGTRQKNKNSKSASSSNQNKKGRWNAKPRSKSSTSESAAE